MGNVLSPPTLEGILSARAESVAKIERSPVVRAVSVPPTDPAPDGHMRVCAADNRLYVRVNGTWRHIDTTA